jgi:hypothetical protein
MDAVNELLQHVEDTHGLSACLKKLRTFHNTNTEVLDLIVQELYDVKAMGWTHASVKSLWEYARWVLLKKRRAPGEHFFMNDLYQSYYARIVVILHPDLNQFFEMRGPRRDDRTGRGPDAELGTKLEHGTEGQMRRLAWADGTPIGLGWRPGTLHEPKTVKRRERVRHRAV